MERATDFLQGKIIGASGDCFDETAGINDNAGVHYANIKIAHNRKKSEYGDSLF